MLRKHAFTFQGGEVGMTRMKKTSKLSSPQPNLQRVDVGWVRLSFSNIYSLSELDWNPMGLFFTSAPTQDV